MIVTLNRLNFLIWTGFCKQSQLSITDQKEEVEEKNYSKMTGENLTPQDSHDKPKKHIMTTRWWKKNNEMFS